MEQVAKINIPIVLPELPDAKDSCIERMISLLDQRDGVHRVHVEERPAGDELCVHFNPDLIPLDQVQGLARSAGAEVTERFRHVVYEASGVRHQRHARFVGEQLSTSTGIIHASASASGTLQLAYDTQILSDEDVRKLLSGLDLHVTRTTKEVPDEHDHRHGGIFGENTELIYAIISGTFLGSGYLLETFTNLSSGVPLTMYILAYLFGGYYTAKEGVETLLERKFEIDFLMLLAAIGAAILGEWAEGALLLFLFSLGHGLENYAMARAKKSIEALSELGTKTAMVRRENKSIEVPVEDLVPGDVVLVKPNSKIAADGIVVKGTSAVNQAPITGESIPVDKFPSEEVKLEDVQGRKKNSENTVFAGTINGTGALEVLVTKRAQDTTLSRLLTLVRDAETQKSPTQQFTDKFEKYFVPSVLLLVVILLFAFLIVDEPFSASFYRAMAVLVAASPCALAISTPSAVLSGVGRAARGGVLIKGGRPLENLGELTAIAFDKTGTLTLGKPTLVSVEPYQTSEKDLLISAMAVESLSDHPLAEAVVTGGQMRITGEEIPEATNLESLTGRGIKARLDGQDILIGKVDLFEKFLNIPLPVTLKEKVQDLMEQGQTIMVVRKGNAFLGVLGLMDTPKVEAKETMKGLYSLGIKRMIMLSGDNQKVAEAVAGSVGLTDAWGNLLPEEKVDSILKLKAQERMVAMVGDGVNDAPAMAKSTVGIAMGAAGSDVALETADIALMSDNLKDLIFAIGLSRKCKRIIKQNLWMSLGVTALLIPATIFNLATIGIAVVVHEGSTLLIVANALRLLSYKKE